MLRHLDGVAMKKLAIVAVAAFVCITYSAESGLSAVAQAPASRALAQQDTKGIRHRNQSELARPRFKYDRDAGQHGITPHYYRPYYYGHYGYYGPWPP